MIELYHDLSDWVVGFAESDWAVLVLALNSFTEAIFFPVPPDPLLVGIAISRPEIALWLGALTTVTSVAGALVGHWLGGRLGRPLLLRFASEAKIHHAERLLKRYGAWATLIAAFTPIPYKVFAILAGTLDMDRRSFVLASLVGRGVRFMTISALAMVFGESITDLVGQNFEIITMAIVSVALAFVVGWIVWRRRNRRLAQR